MSGDGARLYVANEDKGTASVLDITSGKTLAEFEVGGAPEGVTTSPDGRFVYATSEEDDDPKPENRYSGKVTEQTVVSSSILISLIAVTPS